MRFGRVDEPGEEITVPNFSTSDAKGIEDVELAQQAFQFSNFGYAAAMSFVLLALASVIAVVLMRVMNRVSYS